MLPKVLELLEPRRNKVIAGMVAAALLVGGIAFATGGDGEEAAPTTTTSTSTTVPTTTTRPPKPRAPLTGIEGTFRGRIERPALVVKIDNVQPKARPQVGINEADVVYEERVEGSVTRLLAIFHSTDSVPVGPVRSARSSDINIVTPLNRPYFAWSGANADFTNRIRNAPLRDVGYEIAGFEYFREPTRARPHNLMLRSTATALAIQPRDGSKAPPALFKYTYGNKAPKNLRKINGVLVTYGTMAGSAPVEYRWNGKGWARSQAGTPHVDVAGRQVAPENVIIQFTPYASSGVTDQFGTFIPEAQTLGVGEAWVLTKGGLIEARWRKSSPGAVTTYKDNDGRQIRLTPGRTWIALPQPGGGQIL